MQDQLEQNALDLLAELDALSDRTLGLIDKLETELFGLDNLIEERHSLIDIIANQARVASEGVADALGDNVAEKLEKARAPVESAMGAISLIMETVAAKISGEDGLLAVLDEAAQEIQSAEESATALLGEETERAGEVFDDLTAQLATVSSNLESAIDSLESELENQAEEATAQVADNLVAPLREAAEAIKSTWDRLFDEQVTEVLENLFANLNAEIQEPLDEAVDQMAGLLEEELERLVQELQTGDAEGSSVRAGLDEALDALNGVIAPMEAALDAFRGLASSVGVDI